MKYSVVRRSSQGATHIGRGGNGNVFRTSEEADAAKKEQEKGASAIDDAPAKDSSAGWAEKGKNLLFGRRS